MTKNGYPGATKPLDNIRLFGQQKHFKLVNDRISVNFEYLNDQENVGTAPLDSHNRLLRAIELDRVVSVSDHAALSFTLERLGGASS